MNSGVPRFQMDSPRDQPLALQRILNLHSYWNAYLFGFEYFQEIPLQCSRDQPPLANTRQYTFNRLGMNNQPTLVETETCPAWARVRLAGQGAWDFQDNWQLGCCRHTEFFLEYHRKIHALQLQIPAVNKIAANRANTSSTSSPQNKWNKWKNKWNHETNAYKCKAPFVINAKKILHLQVPPKINGINGKINGIMKQIVINAKHLL